MSIKIAILNATENSHANSRPIPADQLAGVALGPSQPPTQLLEGFNLTLERERKSPNVVVFGHSGRERGDTPLYFLLKAPHNVIPCAHLQLELSDIKLPVRTTVNEILQFISPHQQIGAWELPHRPWLWRKFNRMTRLSITITNSGRSSPKRRR